MRKFALLLPLLLAGCSTPYYPMPNIYDVTDKVAVSRDMADCAEYAANYKRPFNTSGVAVSGATGFSGSLGFGATGSKFSPLGPILGGIGGILQSLLQYVGAIDVDTPRAAQRCLWQRFERDRSAILVEPPL
jgi:hypothetical protein